METKLQLYEFKLVGIHFRNNPIGGHFLLDACITVNLCWKCEVWLALYISNMLLVTHHYMAVPSGKTECHHRMLPSVYEVDIRIYIF
jgi:hypothetical protein